MDTISPSFVNLQYWLRERYGASEVAAARFVEVLDANVAFDPTTIEIHAKIPVKVKQ